ncbi:MAG: hypothetical protein COB37_12525 [Kordiimonadales bacterium]|nr:MAG: hypothetical protein COB37_12525 [Kordiimonadales bacterium]
MIKKIIFSFFLGPKPYRFLLASLASVLISIGGAAFFTEIFNIHMNVSVATSLFLAFLFNFFSMRFFVFRSSASVIPQLIHFGVSSAGFRLLEYLLFLTLAHLFGLQYLISLVIILALSFGAKYIYHNLITFKQSSGDQNGP